MEFSVLLTLMLPTCLAFSYQLKTTCIHSTNIDTLNQTSSNSFIFSNNYFKDHGYRNVYTFVVVIEYTSPFTNQLSHHKCLSLLHLLVCVIVSASLCPFHFILIISVVSALDIYSLFLVVSFISWASTSGPHLYWF